MRWGKEHSDRGLLNVQRGLVDLDDPAHRTIIFFQPFQVKKFHAAPVLAWTEQVALRPTLLLRSENPFGDWQMTTALVGEIRPTGLEPVTPRSEVWCSIQLSYGRIDEETIGKGVTVSIADLAASINSERPSERR